MQKRVRIAIGHLETQNMWDSYVGQRGPLYVGQRGAVICGATWGSYMWGKVGQLYVGQRGATNQMIPGGTGLRLVA